eukprot:scaffold1984_cov162-Amphora_coffeaeformis.AAC.7
MDELCGGEPHLLDAEVEKKGVQAMMEDLTEEEKAALADPSMPMRHFRQEKGNTAKALEKLRSTLKWRKEFQVDKIVQCSQDGGDPEIRKIIAKENETGKIYVRGYDKDGRVLMYMRQDRENVRTTTPPLSSLVRWTTSVRAIACTKRKSKQIGKSKQGLEKIILIMDFTKFSMATTPRMSVSKHTLTILQSHYPERVKTIYCFNAPFMFEAFWAMVKPFVDPVTKQKIVFVSGASGMAKFHQNFDEDKESLEELTGGAAASISADDWDSSVYLDLAFDVAFDEEPQK